MTTGVGRPQTYRKSYCKIVFRLCLLKMTNQELADEIPVSLSEFNRWVDEHEEFRQALKKGRERADALVANALLKRALGYRYTLVEEKAGPGGTITAITNEKVALPDVTACIFWLKNRQRHKWFDTLAIANPAGTSDPQDTALKIREATRQIRAMEGLAADVP